MSSALDRFLAEMRAKDGAKVDDPNCYQGATYAALEKWFRVLQTADTLLGRWICSGRYRGAFRNGAIALCKG